jgi:hypothetical protein
LTARFEISERGRKDGAFDAPDALVVNFREGPKPVDRRVFLLQCRSRTRSRPSRDKSGKIDVDWIDEAPV